MRPTAEMWSAATGEVATAKVCPAEMATTTAEVGAPTEMTASAEVGTPTEMTATPAVRRAAAMTAATSAAMRRRVSRGGQNGHENENDKGSKFCHGVGLASELRQQRGRMLEWDNSRTMLEFPAPRGRKRLTDVVT
jgi:hypothetical protein